VYRWTTQYGNSATLCVTRG